MSNSSFDDDPNPTVTMPFNNLIGLQLRIPSATFQPVVSDWNFLSGLESVGVIDCGVVGDAFINPVNRYMISSNATKLYWAIESSSVFQRLFKASRRRCSIAIMDDRREKVLILTRTLGTSIFFVPCRMQEMRIETPEKYLGKIQQVWTKTKPLFEIKNSTQGFIYQICGTEDKSSFMILTEYNEEVGDISNVWSPHDGKYGYIINFPKNINNLPEIKALLVGAAFFLEYNYGDGLGRAN